MDIVLGEFCRGGEIALAECRPSATPSVLYERNFESECFEHFYRGNADVRLVIPYKSVVPKDDLASSVAAGGDGGVAALGKSLRAGVTAPGYSAFREPFVETFSCVMRQRASCGDSNRFLHRGTHDLETKKPIRQPRRETAEFA